MIAPNMNIDYSKQSFTSFRFSKTAQKQLDNIMAKSTPETVDSISKLVESQKTNPVHIFVSKLTQIRKVPVADCFCIKVANQTFDNSSFTDLYDFFKAGATVADKYKTRFN